jgi:hypothetical protein
MEAGLHEGGDQFSAFFVEAIDHASIPKPQAQERDQAQGRGQSQRAKELDEAMIGMLKELRQQNSTVTQSGQSKQGGETDQATRTADASLVALGPDNPFLQISMLAPIIVGEQCFKEERLFLMLGHVD